MSRTKRQMKGTKYRDGCRPFHKCRCDYCMGNKYKNRKGLTIKENSKLCQ